MNSPKLRIKKLKEIEILDYKFQIHWDKTHSGGSFYFSDHKIIIGCKHEKEHPQQVFHVLMHEISEIIHALLNSRYDDPSVDGNYKFFMNHKEFEMHNRLLSNIILKFI